ncbi:MCE family protein [Mycolicibacterium flavescens]|uniref:MCE family protein n=1 Tax=Mycobacterium neumannii TaxID=2048551 RepID=UPI000B944FD7|nr:MlaD family protein [Mycobacterium neumannii]VEG43599.1 MCE family protein [Mycolicibacterium flavescens]
MLTRFVRNQLIIFTIASIVGIGLLVFNYIQAPMLLGIGRITVKLELPASGGLYRFSNVTYRGVKVGEVTGIRVVDGKRVEATLSLDSSPKISADLVARVMSMSAVGEQYVDLQPRNDSPPYLRDGSVISREDTTIPHQVGPMLDKLASLLDTIPQDKLGSLLDETFKAFDGAGYDIGSLIDSSTKLSGELNEVADQTRSLIDDSRPLLNSQTEGSDAIRIWIRNTAGITERIRRNDPQVRSLLQGTPGAADEVARLLTDIKPTLPILLANLTTIGQIAVTYNASLEQLLVLLPPDIATVQAVSPVNNPTGIAKGDFAITISDPPACTVGFLPPSSWRSPADLSDIDTPDGLYCKLPHDSPVAVRGARNYPCMEHPGKRAPTVQLCDSNTGFVPLAQRQHVLGPYPIDPNLIAQGIPLDSRVDADERLYGPIDGTPVPPGSPPLLPSVSEGNESSESGSLPHGAPDNPSTVPQPQNPPASNGTTSSQDGAPAAPASYAENGSTARPQAAVVHYNTRTGSYMAPDGRLYRQSDLASLTETRTWKDLVLGAR